MTNLKTLLFLSLLLVAQLAAKTPRKLSIDSLTQSPVQRRTNAKLVSRFLRLYQQGKKNLRKLQLNVKNEVKDAKKSKDKRKLLMGLSGGQMLGLLGGMGGYYTYNQGQEEGALEFKKLKHEDRMKTYEIMMKTQQRDALIQQMNSAISELENRCDDLGSQVTNKLQDYDGALRRSSRF